SLRLAGKSSAYSSTYRVWPAARPQDSGILGRGGGENPPPWRLKARKGREFWTGLDGVGPAGTGGCAMRNGGEGGIRTPDGLAPMPHFECGAFNHSATSPRGAWAVAGAGAHIAIVRALDKWTSPSIPAHRRKKRKTGLQGRSIGFRLAPEPRA